MYIVSQVIQSVPCIRDMYIFKVLTDLYGSPKEMMCFKSYCSIKLTFCHTACKINIIIVFMTLNASKYKVLITIWNVHVQKNFHNTFFFLNLAFNFYVTQTTIKLSYLRIFHNHNYVRIYLHLFRLFLKETYS